MEIYCTRPGCTRPLNFFADLDDNAILKTVPQKYCTNCGMALILVARYLPSKLLGRGGFGAAFLARDRYTPAMRRCVVKQFQPAGDLTPTQLQIAQNLFEREGEVLEQLGNHPQIPDLYAFFELTVPSLQPGKEDKLFYLVQEFIDGQTLEEELAQKGQFTEKEVLAVLQDILPVLQFVHENGSIHRDIKLSNIIRHQNGRLYLLDFGAVKTAASGATAKPTAARSTGIYSLGFAPPEQMAGGQVYPSTDLYSLAVTCISLLTGKQPLDLFDTYNNTFNWRNDAEVSSHLAGILERMLLAVPNQRFQSAQAVLDTLTSPVPPPIPQPQPTHIQTPQPSPPPPVPSPPPLPAPHSQSSKPRFSLIEVLASAGFTGAEGALLAIALTSLIPLQNISIGLLGMIVAGLIFAQYKRFIERFDLPIILALTLGVVLFLPATHTAIINLIPGNPQIGILFVAVLAGAGAIALTALFRLIYKLLSMIF